MQKDNYEPEFIKELFGLAKQPQTEFEKDMQKLKELNEKFKQRNK